MSEGGWKRSSGKLGEAVEGVDHLNNNGEYTVLAKEKEISG